MQPARQHQQGPPEQPRNSHQENPDLCMGWIPCCEEAQSQPACSATEDELSVAPVSSVRPSRLRSTHAPSDTQHAEVCPKLLQGYLPLVHQIVRQLARRLPANVQQDDLIAAGVVGLLDSLRRNGGDHGGTFEWYARTRIRGAVVDELRAQDWLTRRARAAVSKAERDDTAGPRSPTLVGLQELTGVEESDHFATSDADAETMLIDHDQSRVLTLAIQQLPERERRIVGMHYFEGTKFKDIGAELGVSEPRISQLHTRALELLRVIMEAEMKLPQTPTRLGADRTNTRALRPKRAHAAARVA